jgi:glyceraldehyde 3-phosphate dehydrogenase
VQGKLDGCAMRVPVKDGSVVDLVCELKKKAGTAEINQVFQKAAKGPMKGIIEYTEDPIVSSDVIGQPCSALFDAGATMSLGGKLVKLISWYDNEWGYSNRVVELMKFAHSLKDANGSRSSGGRTARSR